MRNNPYSWYLNDKKQKQLRFIYGPDSVYYAELGFGTFNTNIYCGNEKIKLT